MFALSIGRRLLFAIGVFVLTMFFFRLTTHELSRHLYRNFLKSQTIEVADILLSSHKPHPGKSIFFHETTCNHQTSHLNEMNLTARQACAIESAALNNPNFQAFLLFSCPTKYPTSERQKLLINAIKSYNNVQIRQLSLQNYAKDTPIEEWVRRDELRNSSFPMQHTSDLLRLISLYRYGGIYLDLDVVVLQSLENVQPNYVGGQDNVTLGNGVISLEPTGKGHEIAKLFLDHYQKHYNGDYYVGNGPSLVTSVLLKFCGKSMIKVMQEGRKSCQGFRVFNSTVFYAITWPEWRHFTEPKYLDETMARTKDSYLTHIWNKVSYNTLIKVGSNTALGKYAEKYCPKTYAAAGEYF